MKTRGQPPAKHGKSITMRVPIAIKEQISRIVEAYKNSFKQQEPPAI